MFRNEVGYGKYFNLPNPSLLNHFNRVRNGNDEEYRTTFYKGKTLTKVLDGWMPILKSIQTEWPTLLDFENDLAKKVGPLSIMKPLAQRMDDIESYYESIHLDSKPLDQRAVSAVIAEWVKFGRLTLRSENRTVELMKKSTNSGSPYYIKRRAATDKTVPCNVRITKDDIIMIQDGQEWYACAVLGWRGQEGGPTADDVKQRVVWIFPYAINIKELQFYQPAIDFAKSHSLVPAWESMESVDQRITQLFDTKGPDDLIVCTDFTKFDQHFNSDMQNAAMAIISAVLDDSEISHRWLRDVFPIKYMIPLSYDYGKIRKGAHGMGSGSGGTNFDETLTHRALQYEAAIKRGKRLNPNSMCLGDDGILTYPGITVKDVTEVYRSHGQEMNLSKQYASSQDCTYLRRWHHTKYRHDGICVGVYATCRALGRLCEQERYYDPEVWGPKMVALRQLSIIENCKYHPLREQFVEYCMKGDKYRLGIDIPGFLANIEREAKKAIDYMPEFLGYTKSLQDEPVGGINDWWVVKFLKSKI